MFDNNRWEEKDELKWEKEEKKGERERERERSVWFGLFV